MREDVTIPLFVDNGLPYLEGNHIVVWFSCGAASAMAAFLTLQHYGDKNKVSIVYNPVAEEDYDNLRFLNDVQEKLQHPITLAKHPDYPDASAVKVWEDRQYMAGVGGAPCTMILKKQARQHWQTENKPDYHVLGFTVEEKKRHERFVTTELDNVLPVLIAEGYTKQECLDYMLKQGIEPPRVYRMGFPNANCIGCVKAGSATYWNHVRKMFPDVFQHRAEQSRRIGAKLGYYKGERIFLDELPKDAVGRSMKSMKFDCGIFCEEES